MSWVDAIGLYNYWVVIVLMMAGFYVIIAHDNMVKKIIGLNIFQTSVFIMYISAGNINNATAPIELKGTLNGAEVLYSNPLPHVLILTAIVVGVATIALGLSLIIRIKEAYGTIEEDEVIAQDLADEQEKGQQA